MPRATPLSRRRLLTWGVAAIGGIAALGATGIELVEHGVLPGRSLLDELDGACDVPAARLTVARRLGEEVSGSFYSRARRRVVGYSVGYPPGHSRGSELPLVVMLHGEGGSHRTALTGLTPAQAVGLVVDDAPLRPMALATVDGGRGYWHPHRTDDPMGMVVDELVPMLQGWGLGRPPQQVGAMGISMGGYGAILLAELHPTLVASVAAISPAIWTSYEQASAVNPGAYDSPQQFARFDAVTHATALRSTPVRIAAGSSDPFLAGVDALAARLGSRADVVLDGGCHTTSFFRLEEPPSLAFLASHLDHHARGERRDLAGDGRATT